MVTISHRLASLLVSGCLIAAASGVALADDPYDPDAKANAK